MTNKPTIKVYSLDILAQVESTAEKIIHTYPDGFTILIPCGNHLNGMIANTLQQKASNITIVDDVLTKITTEEVLDMAITKDSPFIKYYINNIEQAIHQLKMYLDKMDEKQGGYFTRHFVKDGQMRDVLTRTLKTSDDAAARYAKDIDGKDVLLIDDSINQGQTIREAISILSENYEPNSITVLTLF